MSILTVSGVSKTFGGLKAVANVDLEVEQGEMHGLIGANGAGKSTLLHLIYGRIRPERGSIRFQGTDVTLLPVTARARMGMGLVFQIISVFDGLSVDENLLLGVGLVLITGLC